MNYLKILFLKLFFLPFFISAQVPIRLTVSDGKIPLSDVRITLIEKDFRYALLTEKEPLDHPDAMTVTTDAQGTGKIRMPKTQDSEYFHKTKSNQKYEMYWEYAFRVQYDDIDVNYYDTVNAIVVKYVKYIPRKIDTEQVIEIEIPFIVNVPRATKTIERQLDSVQQAIRTCAYIAAEAQKNIDADPLSNGQRYYQKQIQAILQALEVDKATLEARLETLKAGYLPNPPKPSTDTKEKIATQIYIKGQQLKAYRAQTERQKADLIHILSLQLAAKAIAAQRAATAFRLSLYEQEVNSNPDKSIETNYPSGKYKISDLDAKDRDSIAVFKNNLIQRYERYRNLLRAAQLQATIILTVEGYTDGQGYGGTWFKSMDECDIYEKNDTKDAHNQCLSALRAKGMKEEVVAGLPDYIKINRIEASHLGKGSILAVTPTGVNEKNEPTFRKCMISTYMKLDLLK